MRRRTTTVALAVLLLASGTRADDPAASPRIPCEYDVTIIWPDASVCGDERPICQPTDINERGVVCGYFRCGPGNDHAFTWTPARDGHDAEFLALPMPEGVYRSFALGISDDGIVAGWFESTVHEPGHGAFIHDGSTATFLGTMPGGNQSEATDVYGGIVVGLWKNNLVGPQHGFIWTEGRMIDLGPEVTGSASAALAISSFGVVGWMGDHQFNDASAFVRRAGRMISIGAVPGGVSGKAVAANSLGQVLVRGKVVEDGIERTRSFVWDDGDWTDLGTMRGFPNTTAHDINEVGQVVGKSSGDVGGGPRFLWQGGRFVDLDGSARLPHFGAIDTPVAITNAGQIIARGAVWNAPGRPVFLLAPIPSYPGDINCDGDVDHLDLLAVLENWGQCVNCKADLNGDSAVGNDDLLIVLENWG